MNIKQIKQKHGLSNKDIAEFFGYKHQYAYNSSSAKKRIEKGLEAFYKKIM